MPILLSCLATSTVLSAVSVFLVLRIVHEIYHATSYSSPHSLFETRAIWSGFGREVQAGRSLQLPTVLYVSNVQICYEKDKVRIRLLNKLLLFNFQVRNSPLICRWCAAVAVCWSHWWVNSGYAKFSLCSPCTSCADVVWPAAYHLLRNRHCFISPYPSLLNS